MALAAFVHTVILFPEHQHAWLWQLTLLQPCGFFRQNYWQSDQLFHSFQKMLRDDNRDERFQQIECFPIGKF